MSTAEETFNDFAVEQAIAALKADKESDPLPAIALVAAVEDTARRELLIGRLAALRIHGVTKAFVGEHVRKHRAEAEKAGKETAEASRRARFMAMDVEGAALLDEVCEHIVRFVNLTAMQAIIVALWTVHTHTFAASDATPYLAITSAEKRSGKTRLLEVLDTLVANSWHTGRATPAVLYRKIDEESPTLLLDESDAALKSGDEYAEAVRGILNTGHRLGGKVTTCEKGLAGAIGCVDFSTFSPKAIAGIGKLPDTVADRSILFRMKRQARGEKVERWHRRDVKTETERLRERLEAWGVQNVEKLRDARPVLPETLSDRQQDGAEPLLAIGDLAGGRWPEAARRALMSLCCGAQAEDASTGTLLLTDIRQILKTQHTDRISSVNLAKALAEIETSPWGEWKKDKPITPRGVADLLKPFDIGPHPVRDDNQVFRGYEKEDFTDAWARYLDPEESPADITPSPPTASANVTPLHPNTDAGSSGFQGVTDEENVTSQKREIVNVDAACNDVTFQKPDIETGGCVSEPRSDEKNDENEVAL